MKGRSLAAGALLAVGSLQMIGSLVGSRALRAVGAATCIAPCPKVFADVDGLETFASRFTFEFVERGARREVAITPEIYGNLRGPYNRRNVYGAALAYAPRLPEGLWRAVFEYALAPGGPLRRELGIPNEATDVRVRIETKTRGRRDVWVLP